jgi:dTDP-4-dehydrorhamnose reductase
VVALGRNELDITDPDSIARALEKYEPWAVVNAAGYVRVDDAEREEMRCVRENTHGAAHLAIASARHGVPLLTFSTDLVFPGSKQSPYIESDATGPLNAYGRSKADAERLVLAACPKALVVRTSAFFGPWDEANFLTRALESWRRDLPVEADHRQVVSPTYVPALVHGCLDLLIDGESGIWHLSGRTALSWRDLALELARSTGHPDELVIAPRHEVPRAPRPRYSALASERGDILPCLDDCLSRYLAERDSPRGEAARAA